MIEFGNRVLSAWVFLAGVVALAVVVIRLGRRDLWLYIGVLFGGYLGEAVLGGLTVLTRLNPLLVAAHFLLAIGLLWQAIVIRRRIVTAATPARPLVGPPLRWLGRAQLAGAGLVLAVGTLVTGTGPHAGSRVDNRLAFNRADITMLHADVVMFLIGATVVTLLFVRVIGVPDRLRRRERHVLVVMVGQAAIGFVQYFAGLPAWLVGAHVGGAALVWSCCLLFYLDMYSRPRIEDEIVRFGGPVDAAANAGAQY